MDIIESRAGIQTCAECGLPMALTDYCVTLMGYFSGAGHSHDDNCMAAVYECQNGHKASMRHRRKCPAAGCDWMGKLTCFCHDGEKVGIWVNDPKDE